MHPILFPHARVRFKQAVLKAFPGVSLCVGVTLVAKLIELLEIACLGRCWLEVLVLAILLGTLIRSVWAPGPRWDEGIEWSAKRLLEVAVVLLGANISGGMILDAGPALLVGIVGAVSVAIGVSYGLGRLFGLPRRMAVLIACGNAICGNSAIAAVAPVIGARSDDVAASIAFTAVLGVAVVLGLPPLALICHMTPRGFGVFAGLTVYAVPQVLAATAPIGLLSVQVATLVKLMRVLLLGPLVLLLSMLAGSRRAAAADSHSFTRSAMRKSGAGMAHFVPWFIVGFLALIAARSEGLVPPLAIVTISQISTWLTVISMAALGLGVDVRMVARAGLRVTLVVVLSLLTLAGVAGLLIRVLGLE